MRPSGARVHATRDTNKLYARQKSCDYHYYQYIRQNRTNLFHGGRMSNMKSSCGLQIPFTARTLPFGPRERAVCHLAACSDNKDCCCEVFKGGVFGLCDGKMASLTTSLQSTETAKQVLSPPGWLNWESAGLLSGRSRVQTSAGPTRRVFK